MTVKVVSCTCNVEAVESKFALQIAPAGGWREPGKLDADLRGYYPLGEYGGTDISGRRNHATVIGLEEPFELVNGILCEQAELMDGRQFLELPFELSNDITVSLWIRPKQVNLESTVLSVGDDVRFGLSWMLEPIVWLNERKRDEDVIAADPVPAEQWSHLTFTRAGDVFQIYVNGQPVALTHDGVTTRHAVTAAETLPGVASISRYRDSSGLHGAYQDVVIRSAALDHRDIKSEYRSYCEALLEAS